MEALAFNQETIRELAQAAQWHESQLSGIGRKRLAILTRAKGLHILSQALSERRDLFHDDIEGRGWLNGDPVVEKFRNEVMASWVWHQADVLYRQERYDEALALIEPVIELLQESRSSRLRRVVADTALAISYQFYLRKEYRKCLAATTVALVDSDYARAWREHGTAHSLLKQYDKAIEFHRKALALDPKDSAAWRELSAAYQFLGRYDEAKAAIEKALELDENDAGSLAWRGYFAMLQGQIDTAEEAFSLALIADQEKSMAWRCTGALAYRLGKLKTAQAKYERAYTASPEYVGNLLDLAAMQRLNGETTTAETHLAKAKVLIDKGNTDSFVAAQQKAQRKIWTLRSSIWRSSLRRHQVTGHGLCSAPPFMASTITRAFAN